LAGLGLLPLLGLGNGVWQDDPAADAVEEGNRLFEQGDYAAAFDRYLEAEAIRPEAHEIRLNEGDALAKAFDYEGAVERLTAASETDDPQLASQIQYNLGVVKYRQALDALQTFQDAMGNAKAAIRHWRESLALWPDQGEDARYNLELAYRLIDEIEAQRVQAQRNAETRNQKTSDNRGQRFEDEEERASNDPSDRDVEPTSSDGKEAGQGRSGSQAAAPTRQMTQMQEAGKQDDLTAAAAEELLELMRKRALAARNQRQAEQQVRIRADRQEKFW
jgi:tetratricopeptide (TPR) repeat protein